MRQFIDVTGKTEDEARHDVVAGDAVFVVAVALAHLDGARGALLAGEGFDDRRDVARRHIGGGGVSRVGGNEDFRGFAPGELLCEVVGEIEADQRVALVHGLLESLVGLRGSRAHEDAVRFNYPDHAFARRALRSVVNDVGGFLEIEGRAVAEENRLRDDGNDEDPAHAGVAQECDELLAGERAKPQKRGAEPGEEGAEGSAGHFGLLHPSVKALLRRGERERKEEDHPGGKDGEV